MTSPPKGSVIHLSRSPGGTVSICAENRTIGFSTSPLYVPITLGRFLSHSASWTSRPNSSIFLAMSSAISFSSPVGLGTLMSCLHRSMASSSVTRSSIILLSFSGNIMLSNPVFNIETEPNKSYRLPHYLYVFIRKPLAILPGLLVKPS